MENITTGHWIFASVFIVVFLFYLTWSYRKDLKLHKLHYSGSWYILVAIIFSLFAYYVLKQMLH